MIIKLLIKSISSRKDPGSHRKWSQVHLLMRVHMDVHPLPHLEQFLFVVAAKCCFSNMLHVHRRVLAPPITSSMLEM